VLKFAADTVSNLELTNFLNANSASTLNEAPFPADGLRGLSHNSYWLIG